jgi:hypothetical protein
MKLIVALRGTTSCGKTSTLRELIQVLEERKGINKLEVIHESTGLNIDAIITVNGLQIGIVSEQSLNLERKLQDMFEQGVQVIFTACRTRGKTVLGVERLAGTTDAEVVWTSPYIHTSNNGEAYVRLNRLKAEHLTELLFTELGALG